MEVCVQKFIIVLSIFVISGIVGIAVYAQNSNPYTNDFINSFKTCKPYTYSIGPIDMFGMKVSTRKRIVGVRNGLCSYIEVVGPINAKYTIRCNFTKEQVNKLVTAMRNNDGDAAWTEYLNNKNVCTTESPDGN